MDNLNACVACDREVRPRQEAICCDICSRWQHRTCGTNIDRSTYRNAVKGIIIIEWICRFCETLPLPEKNTSPTNSPVVDSHGTFVLDTSVLDISSRRSPVSAVSFSPELFSSPEYSATARSLKSPLSSKRTSSARTLWVPQTPSPSTSPPLCLESPKSSSLQKQTFALASPNRLFSTSPDSASDMSPINRKSSPLKSVLTPAPMTDLSESTEYDVDVVIPERLQELSLLDLPPEELADNKADKLTYTIVDGSSQRQRSKLVDSNGYSYTVKRTSTKSGQTVTDWRCTKRSKQITCPATVRQTGDSFTEGKHSHIHPPETGALTAVRVYAAVKSEARTNLFSASSSIVNKALLEEVDQKAPCPSLPKPDYLARIANRTRQTMRPKDPVDLHFTVDTSFIDSLCDGFLRGDVTVGSNRHLLLATTEKLSLLVRAKTWYIDGTFKVVKAPFTQLLSIHAFARKDDATKQIPLIFVLMSGKRTKDYVAILEKILTLLPHQPLIKEAVVDFEMAMWKALSRVQPNTKIRGCSFHWAQAVWRKIQELGLQRAYHELDSTHQFCRRIFALPFLPAEHIPGQFRRITGDVSTPALTDLVTYLGDTWVNQDAMWEPAKWSVFNQSVRTNNDCEGWHRRLNHAAGKSCLPMYLLIALLVEESKLVSLSVKLISQDKLKRHQRKKYADLQRKIFSAWKEFLDGEKSAKQLLSACSKLAIGPVE